MAIPFLAVEISGLATQTYASGAVNRSFVDSVSGSLAGRIASVEGAANVSYGAFTPEDSSIEFDGGTFAVSSQGGTALSIKVAGYSTISSQAKSAYSWSDASGQRYEEILASGTKYTLAYDWFNASSQKLTASSQAAYYTDEHVDHDQTTNFVANEHVDHSGVDITAGDGLTGGGDITTTRTLDVGAGTGILVNANDIEVAGYSTISSNAKAGADYVASGNEYTAAYMSAQALKAHAFHAKISSTYLSMASGWQSVSDDTQISHNLNAIPNTIIIQPSGAVTFATGYDTVTTTTFRARISAPGSRVINWRAEL